MGRVSKDGGERGVCRHASRRAAARRSSASGGRSGNKTARPDGDCPGGPRQSARGWKGGGRADRLEVLPRYRLVDDVADFARAAVVAVRVVALDIAAGGVAVARADEV